MERDLLVLTVFSYFGALLAVSASRRLVHGPQGRCSLFESAGVVFLWCAAFGLVRGGMAVLLDCRVLGVEARDTAFFAGLVVSYGLLVECLRCAWQLPYPAAALHAFVLAAAYFASRSVAYDLLLGL
jgi:hypothetical protein